MNDTATREVWLAFDRQLFDAFDDFALTVLDQIAEGNKVATRYVLGGTHTGELAGMAPTGNVALLSATSFDVIENGQIVEHWVDFDLDAWIKKLSSPAEQGCPPPDVPAVTVAAE